MNVRMWLHKATQLNLKRLQDFGYLFIGPEKGEHGESVGCRSQDKFLHI